MRTTTVDQRIEAIASPQHGAFSRQQAFEAGATDRFVHARLAQQVWLRPVPAVYTLASSSPTWRRQCKLAELSVPGSALGCRTAAAVQGATGFRPGPIELAIPVNSSTRHPFATLHRFAGALTTRMDGFQVTTPAQTMFDCAMFVGPMKVERAVDDFLASGAMLLRDLVERAEFYAGSRRPGLPVMQRLIAERSDDAWEAPASELEVLLFALLDRLQPEPIVLRQHGLPWRATRPGRVDALLPEHRLILEADGRRWHTRVADFDRDRWRDNEAVAHGYRVQRFTWLHLHDMVDDALALLRRTIEGPAADAA